MPRRKKVEIESEEIKAQEPEKVVKKEEKPKAVVNEYEGEYEVRTHLFLNIRKKAGLGHPVVGRYNNGDVVKCSGDFAIDDQNKVWLKTDKGWCMMDFLLKK